MAAETSSDYESKPSGLKIKIFSGREQEWPEWKAKFQAVLRSKKLLKHLSSEPPDEALDDSALFEERAGSTPFEKWLEDDEALFYELIIHTTGMACKLVQQFEERTQGRKAWELVPQSKSMRQRGPEPWRLWSCSRSSCYAR